MVKTSKIKDISVALQGDVDQLRGAPLTADRRVKRRGKYRCEEGVDAVSSGGFGKVFDDFPVRVRPHVHVVIVGQTIGVEPLREVDIFVGEDSVYDFDRDRGVTATEFSAVKGKGKRVLTGLDLLGNVDLDPYGLQNIARKGGASVVIKRP